MASAVRFAFSSVERPGANGFRERTLLEISCILASSGSASFSRGNRCEVLLRLRILGELKCGSRCTRKGIFITRVVRQQSLKLLQRAAPHSSAKQQVPGGFLPCEILRARIVSEGNDFGFGLIHCIVVQQILAKLFANLPAHGNRIRVPYAVNRSVVVAECVRHHLRPAMRGYSGQFEIRLAASWRIRKQGYKISPGFVVPSCSRQRLREVELKICVAGRVKESVAIVTERRRGISRMKILLAPGKPLISEHVVFLVIHAGGESGEYHENKKQQQGRKENNLARIFLRGRPRWKWCLVEEAITLVVPRIRIPHRTSEG